MSKRFHLFGEKPFEAYALEKFSDIAYDIARMSDVEAMMYKYCFDELVQKTVSAYQFKNVDISFENKLVDLINRPYRERSNFYAEYSLMVTGNTYYLGLQPFRRAYLPFILNVTLTGNVMSFEIDTDSQEEELSQEATAMVKEEYDLIKTYIHDSLFNMRHTIDHFNAELEKFVIFLLAEKLRKAERSLKIRESLNFQ